MLSSAPDEVRCLYAWLRPRSAGGDAALQWLRASNVQAAAIAYTTPDWWSEFLAFGLPTAREVLRRCQLIELPPEATDRHSWLERHYITGYRNICANLLLALAAASEVDELIPQAKAGDVAAIRALGMAGLRDDIISTLVLQLRTGGRPQMAAAELALDQLAHRAGHSGSEELLRQQFLAQAWDESQLGCGRVRTDWQTGIYRLRLSLHGGKVRFEALGPRGPLARIPEELRQSDVYREARAAEHELQVEYRRYRGELERWMMAETPVPVGQFRYLLANPVFAHLAERLVWRDAAGVALLWAGEGRWEDVSSAPVALDAGFTLTLAHPITLGTELKCWQSRAADIRLQQPFRQLFREIYTPFDAAGQQCERFAGRRISPARSYAVLRAAGYAPGSGIARHEWPGGITAQICWAEGAVSHDLYGAEQIADVACGGISFTRDGEVLSLQAVPPIVFSETLRVADLLTTRAAVGEESLTSAETLAVRRTLLREMARTYDLTNIATPDVGNFALVLGTHATYRVNLTTGTVLLEPEGRQIVLPELSERWHYAEGDDATTHVIAVMLALAHDAEISDLTFLAQL
ncbi:MAG: DUF4132 domain-containing protein [bacterium]